MIFDSCPECQNYWTDIEREFQCCRLCEYGNHNNYIDWGVVDKYIGIEESIQKLKHDYKRSEEVLNSIQRNISFKEDELYKIQKEIERNKSKPLNKIKKNLFSGRSKFGKIMSIFWTLTVGPAFLTGPMFGIMFIFPGVNDIYAVLWALLCLCVFALSWAESFNDRYYS